MRGRLTLDKVNAAISDMAAYAEANAQLITAPTKKVSLIIFLLLVHERNSTTADSNFLLFTAYRKYIRKSSGEFHEFFLAFEIVDVTLLLAF